MTRKVVSPIALDKSINTTEQTPRNIADVLAQQLEAIKTAIESGNVNLEAAFVCYYGVTTATQIKDAIEDGKVPYFYYNGAVAQLWKVETDKYTFRTTNTRSVEGQTILDVVDYVVNGSVWSTITSEVSGGSSSGQSYIASVNSLADFDTTGKSGMNSVLSVDNVPADGVYQLSVMLHITPKTASATKSDLVFQFTGGDGTGWPNHTFHAVVDDSQTFAQHLSFSTSVSLKEGQNTLRIQCGNLNTEYLVFVDELTIAQLLAVTVQADGWFSLTPTTSQSENFRINSSGSVESAEGYRLNRYYVAGLGGKTIRISSDYNSVFSTTDSASQKITTGLPSGEYIVPANANYLIVSHTKDGYFDVDIRDYVIPSLYGGDKTRIAPYDTSVGYKINSSGSVESDPEWSLVRFHTDTLLNSNVEIDTEGYSVFSESDSVSSRVTLALEAGNYVVPNNGTYLIISVKTDTPYGVYLITDDTTAGKYGTYGLQMRWSENTTYRLRSSIGKSFAVNNTTGEVTSDFDTCYPWCDMRVCNIEDPYGLRTITYKGETGFSYNKDTYIEIPKFYFKRVFDPNTEYEYWYISSNGGDGFELEPLFINDDGTEAPVRYIARYNLGVGGDISRTGIAAYTNVSKSDLKSYCESNNVKLMNIFAYQALVHLFVIESGTKNSQSIFNGVSFFRYFTETTDQTMLNPSATTDTIQIPTTDVRNTYFGVGDRVAIFPSASTDFSSAIIRTLTSVSYGGNVATLKFDGESIALTQGVSRIYGVNQLNGNTDSITANSGRTTNGDQHTRSFSYRGIENLWGNLGELIDGVEYDYSNRRFKIGNKYVCFETPLNRSYIEVPSVQRWIKYFGIDPSYPTITLPSAPLTESFATSYKDEWSTFGNESGVSDVSYGCAWDHQDANGVMCFRNVRDTGNILYTGRAML